MTGKKFRVKAKDLYKAYQAWVAINNGEDIGQVAFGKEIKNRFESKLSGGTKYLGVKLK